MSDSITSATARTGTVGTGVIGPTWPATALYKRPTATIASSVELTTSSMSPGTGSALRRSNPPACWLRRSPRRRQRPLPAPDERRDLIFEKVPGGRGGYNRWTINGKSWPATNPLFTTERGKRYRLAMSNKSGDNHPVHLHRHTFEITKVGDKATAGVMKDTVNIRGSARSRLISSPTIRDLRCSTATISGFVLLTVWNAPPLVVVAVSAVGGVVLAIAGLS
jgi:FtsP/CotA-like multicopper oxidase with cupredoxin domain